MSRLGSTALAALRDCLSGASDLLLPACCAACGTPEVAADGLCSQCGLKLLSLVALPYCPRCGATVGPNIPLSEEGCSACPTVLPRFASVIRVGPYAPPLRSVIQQLKYHRREGMLRRLGELLAAAVAARLAADRPAELVMPVPTHWRRRLTRGYDHAGAIARQLARRLEAPLGDELIRVRHTQPQVGLPRTRRIEAVRGAFEARPSGAIAGAHVLLVDDVTTTGATANEASRTLLGAGAGKITLAVLAKAEPPSAYAAQWR